MPHSLVNEENFQSECSVSRQSDECIAFHQSSFQKRRDPAYPLGTAGFSQEVALSCSAKPPFIPQNLL